MNHEHRAAVRCSMNWVCVLGTLGLSLMFALRTARSADQARPVCGHSLRGVIWLFDGRGTNRFVSAIGGAIDWEIADGALVSAPNGRRSNNLVSALHFRDAEIHVEFQLPSTGVGNSGVFLHGQYELQILDRRAKDVKPIGRMGAIYGLHPPLVAAGLPAGALQSLDVRYRAPRRSSASEIVDDGIVSAWLNGQLIHDGVRVAKVSSPYNPFEYDTTEYLAAIAARGRRNLTGPLLLQDHDSPVRFRSIWVRPLDSCYGWYDPNREQLVPCQVTRAH